ncbi:MAG TPA: glycosyltransferase [Planctomycetota bacterium]|nr:glycosyltransferase [Planctomycetota bacterium]
MKILIIDGPGVHPRTSARALGGALHAKGHVVIVHPILMEQLGWFKSSALAKRVAAIIETHEPDILHIFTSEPSIADAFTGKGVPVVHAALDKASKADWVLAPSRKALTRMGGPAPTADERSSVYPYPVVINENPSTPGTYVLVHVPRRDREAKAWIAQAASMHKDVPVRYEGDPEEARVVISVSSKEESWPVGVAEAMAAGRPVIAGWNGAAEEFVLEGVTGFLSAPGDIKSLASHMNYLWSKPEEAVDLGLAGRIEAAARFGGDEHLRTLLRWYLRAGTSRLSVSGS